jgi:hypothetical protein
MASVAIPTIHRLFNLSPHSDLYRPHGCELLLDRKHLNPQFSQPFYGLLVAVFSLLVGNDCIWLSALCFYGASKLRFVYLFKSEINWQDMRQ